jgi:hypothetical protein
MIPLWGYGLRVLRGTINNGEPPLPAWDEFGELFREGLRVLLVRLFYWLPVILLYGVMFIAWLAFIPGTALLGTVGNTPAGAAAGVGAMLVIMAVFMGGSALVMPLMLLGNFFAQVALVRYVVTGSLKAAFDLRGVWKLARFGLKYFALALLAWGGIYVGLNFVSGVLSATFVLLPLLPFIAGAILAYQVVMGGALYGMAYNQVKSALAVAGTMLPDFDAIT